MIQLYCARLYFKSWYSSRTRHKTRLLPSIVRYALQRPWLCDACNRNVLVKAIMFNLARFLLTASLSSWIIHHPSGSFIQYFGWRSYKGHVNVAIDFNAKDLGMWRPGVTFYGSSSRCIVGTKFEFENKCFRSISLLIFTTIIIVIIISAVKRSLLDLQQCCLQMPWLEASCIYPSIFIDP